MITLNIPSPRKKKSKKPAAKELWNRASHSVQNVSRWKNSESSTNFSPTNKKQTLSSYHIVSVNRE